MISNCYAVVYIFQYNVCIILLFVEAGTSGNSNDGNNDNTEQDRTPMDVDYNDIIRDSSFMQRVLDNLPGVDQVSGMDDGENTGKKHSDKNNQNNGGKSGKK